MYSVSGVKKSRRSQKSLDGGFLYSYTSPDLLSPPSHPHCLPIGTIGGYRLTIALGRGMESECLLNVLKLKCEW
jgi:hypothetical protein